MTSITQVRSAFAMETEAAVAETGAREAQTEGIQFGSAIWGRTPRGQDKSRNIHSTSSGSGEIHSDEEEVADFARDASVEIQGDAVVTESPGGPPPHLQDQTGT